MTTKRTDTHRPAEFDPAEYTEVGCFDNHPEEGGCWVDPEFTGKDEFSGNYTSRGRCDHCGAGPLRYGVVFWHEPTDTTVVVGNRCATKLSLGSRSEVERRQLVDQAKRQAKRQAFEDSLTAADREALAWMHDVNITPYVADDGSKPFAAKFPGLFGETVAFLGDLDHKLHRYGTLSERQVAAIVKIKARVEETARKRAEEAAAITEPLPTGRVQIEGEILSVKWKENMYGGSLKMLVRLDDGNKVWGTVPSYLSASHDDDALRGSRVRFTATVEASDDDEHFGFFKRPTGSEIVEPVAA